MQGTPDFLAGKGIVRIADNLEGGSLKPQAGILARLFGEAFLKELRPSEKPAAGEQKDESLLNRQRAEKTDLYIPGENRKGGKHDHSVYLTKSLRVALINLIDIRGSFNAEHYLIAGRTDQEPMSTRNMQQRVKSWANQAGLSHLNVTPHFFRHTMAMNLIRNSSAKEPLRIVKSALGHRNINTTAIYTAATREEVAEAMEEADNVTPNRITLARLRAFHKSQKAV